MVQSGRRSRRAFLLTDAAVGFLLIGAIGLMLVVSITTASKAGRRLDDSARAAVAAEQALAMLRDGRSPPQTIGDASVQVRPAEGGTTVVGRRWVEVTARRNGRTAALIALVPQEGAKP
jgi:hypothetical protein